MPSAIATTCASTAYAAPDEHLGVRDHAAAGRGAGMRRARSRWARTPSGRSAVGGVASSPMSTKANSPAAAISTDRSRRDQPGERAAVVGAGLARLGHARRGSWRPPGVGRPGPGRPAGGRQPGRRRAAGRTARRLIARLVPPSRLLMSGTGLDLSELVAQLLPAARCSRMLTALGVMSSTVGDLGGRQLLPRPQPQQLGVLVAAAGRAPRAGVVAARRPGRPPRGAGRPRPAWRPPLLAAHGPLGVGQAVARDAVGPRQRSVGHLVEPAPAHQQRLGQHVVGGRRVGTPGQEPSQRLDQLLRASASNLDAAASSSSPTSPPCHTEPTTAALRLARAQSCERSATFLHPGRSKWRSSHDPRLVVALEHTPRESLAPRPWRPDHHQRVSRTPTRGWDRGPSRW